MKVNEVNFEGSLIAGPSEFQAMAASFGDILKPLDFTQEAACITENRRGKLRLFHSKHVRSIFSTNEEPC